MKTFALAVLVVTVGLFVWLYNNYPTPMLMGSFAVLFASFLHLVLKKFKNPEKISLVLFLILGLPLILVGYFLHPSLFAFIGSSGNGLLDKPNLWHGLIAAFVHYFAFIVGLWAWTTAEISEFLTKQGL